MVVVARNNKLRDEIDAGRHERNTLTTARISIEKEIKTLAADSARLETVLQQKVLAREEVEHETANHKTEALAEQEGLEQIWLTLGQDDETVSPTDATASLTAAPLASTMGSQVWQ
jgi:hypothetical protein